MTQERRWHCHQMISDWYEDAFKDTTDRKVEYYSAEGVAMVRLVAMTSQGKRVFAEYPRDSIEAKIEAVKEAALWRRREEGLANVC